MKRVQTRVARQVKVIKNSVGVNAPKYAVIRDAVTGQQLHIGRPNYIARVAKTRYNTIVSFDI